jgi:hypothetical protein
LSFHAERTWSAMKDILTVQGLGCNCISKGEAFRNEVAAPVLPKHGRYADKDVGCLPAIVKSSVRRWVLAGYDDDDAQ